jgi:protein involved in polysaccharide export with SLBB domain
MRHTPKNILLSLIALCLLVGGLCAQESNERTYSRMDLLDNETVIKATDRLRYQVLEEQSPAVVLVPDSEGKMRFPPLSHSIEIEGKTCYELAHELQPLLLVDFFKRATVVISIAESSFRESITLYGMLRDTGKLFLPREGNLTISQAISQKGGFQPGADMKSVIVRRTDAENPDKELRIEVNMEEIITEGIVENDIVLLPGDTIIVGKEEEVGGRYSVLGAVNEPGLYTIEDESLTVSQAILLAGGFTDVARTSRVKLTRQIEDTEESETFFINVKRVQDGIRSEDMEVKPDDIIKVEERIIIF